MPHIALMKLSRADWSLSIFIKSFIEEKSSALFSACVSLFVCSVLPVLHNQKSSCYVACSDPFGYVRKDILLWDLGSRLMCPHMSMLVIKLQRWTFGVGTAKHSWASLNIKKTEHQHYVSIIFTGVLASVRMK